jgi:hypothetical protein
MLHWRRGGQNLADAGCAAADDWEPGTPQPIRKTFKLMVCCFALSRVVTHCVIARTVFAISQLGAALFPMAVRWFGHNRQGHRWSVVTSARKRAALRCCDEWQGVRPCTPRAGV